MNIKQILAGVALILPFAVTSIPSQASALQVIVKPHAINRPAQIIANKPPQVKRYTPPVKKKVLVPAHWEKNKSWSQVGCGSLYIQIKTSYHLPTK